MTTNAPCTPTHWSRNFLFVVLALFFLLGCASSNTSTPKQRLTRSAETWTRYKPVSLNELKGTIFDHPLDHPQDFVGMTINAEATAKPYKLMGAYKGDLRAMSPFRKEFIQKWWGSMFGVPAEFTRLFESEMLFEVEGGEYWMPVLTQLIPHFQRELSKGDMLDLYVMVVGTIDDESGHEWIIIVNEFKKKPSPFGKTEKD